MLAELEEAGDGDADDEDAAAATADDADEAASPNARAASAVQGRLLVIFAAV